MISYGKTQFVVGKSSRLASESTLRFLWKIEIYSSISTYSQCKWNFLNAIQIYIITCLYIGNQIHCSYCCSSLWFHSIFGWNYCTWKLQSLLVNGILRYREFCNKIRFKKKYNQCEMFFIFIFKLVFIEFEIRLIDMNYY